ncbi:SDR family oxidoreductase [Arthrobacter sp. NPDC080031]|uniref:SDR family NAD(P)-dependent oxidoreductase n=1 Tax=Arthrobacter sp. NPDC080031 TaxID=3155918 RepID=UPI00344BCEC6
MQPSTPQQQPWFALVTGAASGIGRATALKFAAAGATGVACLDVHVEGNASTSGEVELAGARALEVTLDLGDYDSIVAAYETVHQEFGRLDAAAHVGGYSWRGDTLGVTPQEWDRVVGVNLRGTFFCCQQALAIMYPQGSGGIVNMSADAAFDPIHGYSVQAAAKGGVVPLTKALAFEAARRGVRVNAVSPGITRVKRSGFVPDRGAPVVVPGGLAADSSEGLEQHTGAGRWMETDEIASVIAFLAGPASSGVNGELVRINGGPYPTLEF